MADFLYAVAEDRGLTQAEREIVVHLLAAENLSPLYDVAHLRVRGRCGCGVCPTIMFVPPGAEADGARRKVIADYLGTASDGRPVGVLLRAVDGTLSELEAWSPDGAAIGEWPLRASLGRFSARSV